MVNVDNVRALIKIIADEQYSFDMHCAVVVLNCNSAGCIGGHAAVLWPQIRRYYLQRRTDRFSWDHNGLADKLGLTDGEANRLCFPSAMGQRSRSEALEVLNRLAESGEVYWKPKTFNSQI